jgi:hypothetical protein
MNDNHQAGPVPAAIAAASPVRALIYARYSTTLQSEASIEDQVRICRERAEREGWAVAGVHTDYAISGGVRDRPGLNGLLQAIVAGVGDVVLAESIDRLSRDQEDIAGIFKRVAFAGARMVTLSEGEIGELHVGLKGHDVGALPQGSRRQDAARADRPGARRPLPWRQGLRLSPRRALGRGR